MKYIIYFMMMLYGSLCHAIVCKHIVERSETNTRKVYQIQRDALGYMWFMNHAGIIWLFRMMFPFIFSA